MVRVAVVAAVVLGRATVVDPNAAFQVKARATVVDDATEIFSIWPSYFVPPGALKSKAPV